MYIFLLLVFSQSIIVDGIAAFLEKPVFGEEENALKKNYYITMLNKLSGEAEFPDEMNFRDPAGKFFQMSSMASGNCSLFYPQKMKFSPSEVTLQELSCVNMRSSTEYNFVPGVRDSQTVILNQGDDEQIYGTIGNSLVHVTLNKTAKRASYKQLDSILDTRCDFISDAIFTDESFVVMCGSGQKWVSSYFLEYDTTKWMRKKSWTIIDEKIFGLQYFSNKLYGVYESDSEYYFGYIDIDSVGSKMNSLIRFSNIYGSLGSALHLNMYYAIIAGESGTGPYELGYYLFVFDLLKGKTFMFNRIYDDQGYRYDVGMYMKYVYFAT